MLLSFLKLDPTTVLYEYSMSVIIRFNLKMPMIVYPIFAYAPYQVL